MREQNRGKHTMHSVLKAIPAAELASLLLLSCFTPVGSAETKLLWGDTHLHTSYSFDAFLNNNLTADPDTAYRFAKGQPVIHPYHRARVQLKAPLDFLVVSDHAEFLGGMRDIYANGIRQEDAGPIDRILNWYRTRTIRQAVNDRQGVVLFRTVLPVSEDPQIAASTWLTDRSTVIQLSATVTQNAWHDIVESADAHYLPGTFTSLIGWEWSSSPGGANLHRVVVTDANGETAKSFQPFSSIDSPYPEDLWARLAELSAETGAEFLAIPHNSNISKGVMFDTKSLRGEPIGADYAATRMRWEPIVEVTQIKGDSETHPALSPGDEFADFEEYPYYLQQQPGKYTPGPGDYVRSALKTGLALGAQLEANPYQFGLIGSTDSHTGLASAEEDNFWGKMATDSTPETKNNPVITGGSNGWTMSASGLAAVWAEENTRESIIAAMQRREVYATTGPRLRVRFFGGWQYVREDLDSENLTDLGYAKGVPMGGILEPGGAAPTFMVVALKEPNGANLDRIQIIKGWLNMDGSTSERVFDVVWSGDRRPGTNGKLPAVGNSVDLPSARYSNTIGAVELATVWQDPNFNPQQPAFYYARILQIPTPRHSQYDARALGLEAPSVGPAIIQERAYTSPIWYTP
jgi:hypothetical protein